MLARAFDLSKDRVEIDFNQAPGDSEDSAFRPGAVDPNMSGPVQRINDPECGRPCVCNRCRAGVYASDRTGTLRKRLAKSTSPV
jgi:hypothetical protein